MFNCQDIMKDIDAFVDDEFDAKDRAEFEMHLAQCDECWHRAQYHMKCKMLVRKSLDTPAPPELKNRIFASLKNEPPRAASVKKAQPQVDALVNLPPANNTNQPSFSARNKTIIALLAVAAIGLFVFLIPQWTTITPATTEGLSVWDESVDWHRSDIPMEVQGSPQQVADWFKGKVNFAVSPIAFGPAANAKLIGGRLASVYNRRAALLDYTVDGTDVTVLIFDGKGITVPSDKLQIYDEQPLAVIDGPGYNVALFHKNDLAYTITTDLPSAKFETLMHKVLQSNK